MTEQPVQMWVCPVCGYIHYGAEPPEECPVCGAAQAQFEPALAAQPAPAAARVTRWVCPICGYVHEGSRPTEECPVCGAAAEDFEPESLPEPVPAPGAWNGRIVIVGAGIAGVSAAESARQAAPRAQITLISAEPHRPYYRLSLTRYLAGQIGADQLELHPPDWYEQNQIELRLGQTVCEIDLEQAVLVLADGLRVAFDRLVLASGSHPFVPPFPGADRQNVLTLRTRQDAETLLSASRAYPEVVCIGGGLLGLETAGALARQSARVHVVENMAWLLPRQLNETAGNLLKQKIEQMGIQIHTNARTRELVGDEQVRGVLLEDGTCLSADLVVISAGVRANLNLARQAGLQVNQGILVDDAMQTSHPRVFAAGDVCEHRGALYGTWPPAQLQGAAAGRSAAAEPGHFSGVPRSTALKVLGVDVFSIGQFNPEGPADLRVAAETNEGYACFVFRGGRMIGSILLGVTALTQAVKQAVESGRDFTNLLGANPGIAEVMAFLSEA